MIWIVGDNTVTEYEGDFEDYRDELVQEFEAKQLAEEEERKHKREEQIKQKQEKVAQKN